MSPEIQVFDDVLPDPLEYRARALEQAFQSVTIGADTFHGMAPAPFESLRHWLPDATLSFFRLSPAGQVEPNDVHTDESVGERTGILYLNPDPPEGDGTTFYKRKDTGSIASRGETQDEWRHKSQWAPWKTVAAKFNRLLVFPAPFFHARALLENYGNSPSDARLIQVIFAGDPTWR